MRRARHATPRRSLPPYNSSHRMTPPLPASAHALHVSACAAERRDRAAAFLAGLPRDAPVLMLVPTPNAGLWLMKEVLAPGDARFGWRRLSLEQHCHALARPALLHAGKSYLSPVAAQALSTRVMLDMAARGELGRFAAVSSHPGFGRALWSTLAELRMAGVAATALEAHDPDLARLAAAFDAALQERALVDLAALYTLAAERARTLRIAALLALDIPIAHALEAELVRALTAACERACVTIPLGDTQTLAAFRAALPAAEEQHAAPSTRSELGRLQAHLFERDLSAHMPQVVGVDARHHAPSAQAEMFAAAERGAPSAQAEMVAAAERDAPTVQHHAPGAQAEMFAAAERGAPSAQAEMIGAAPGAEAGRSQPLAEQRELPVGETASAEHAAALPVAEHSVHFVSSPGESRECVEVARAVLAAAHSGVPFDAMAVLVRAVDNYRSFLEEAFERAQLPAHFAAGVRRPAPEGRAFALLLRCAVSGLSTRRFAEYLSLGVMPRLRGGDVRDKGGVQVHRAVDDDEDTPRPGEAPESVDSEPAPRVSPRYWERLLTQAEVGGQSANWRKQLLQLHTRWSEALQLLAPDDAQRAAGEKRLAALDALTTFALPVLAQIEALPERATFDQYRQQLSALAEQALDKPGEVQALLAELSPLDHAQLNRRALVQLLAPHLHSLIVPSEGSGAGKLQVLPVEEARGRSFQRVFVVGLAEKLMPPRLREDPLLPDALRALVSPALARMPERVARERLSLRIAVAAASQQLHLSFPRFDAEQGRPRVPSFYGLEILEAVDGRLPAWSELGERASLGAAARLGWPAPEEPTQAIDDAEYDLAVIARARGALDTATGALRYLVGTNPHLTRALRFRARRWELQKFVAADGFIVTDDGAREQLREYLAEHRYSASALEQLAACPYRFFLRSIVRVAEPDQAQHVAALDARERGVLFHQLLHDTLTQLGVGQTEAPHVLDAPAAEAALEHALQQLQAERTARDPQRARLVELELKSLRADLQGFVRDQSQSSEWAPRATELRFGDARVGAAVSVAGLPLSGAIDLVEQASASGQDADAPVLRATDFKTGGVSQAVDRRSGRRSITAGGMVLQPLLYALALEKLFPEAQVRAGRLYYCTRQQQYESHVVELNERTREIAARLAQYANDMLRQGFLPAAPDTAERCSQCEYQVICGPHEAERVQNVKMRDGARLRSLNLLRGLP
jgi:ATP-dependent helicase/nuclease subunit B